MEQLFVDKLVLAVHGLDISLTDLQIEQFYHYYQLLMEWNKVMNLTAIKDLDDVIYKHFVDSISLTRLIDISHLEHHSMIDVGSGAGFPGIPLKILCPSLQMTLLDSLNKRIKFLNTVIQALDFKNIVAIHGRTEDVGHEFTHREKYDLCVSRAVANMATLSEYCLPFVKPEGYFIPYKSGQINEELEQAKRSIRILGGEMKRVIKFQLPGTDLERSLILIKKARVTEKKYPRKSGLPQKHPL